MASLTVISALDGARQYTNDLVRRGGTTWQWGNSAMSWNINLWVFVENGTDYYTTATRDNTHHGCGGGGSGSQLRGTPPWRRQQRDRGTSKNPDSITSPSLSLSLLTHRSHNNNVCCVCRKREENVSVEILPTIQDEQIHILSSLVRLSLVLLVCVCVCRLVCVSY